MSSAVRARISPILPWSQLVGRLPCVPEWTVAVIATRPRRSHYRLLEFGHASLLSLLFLLLRFPCFTPPPTLTGRREREMRKGQGYRSKSRREGESNSLGKISSVQPNCVPPSNPRSSQTYSLCRLNRVSLILDLILLSNLVLRSKAERERQPVSRRWLPKGPSCFHPFSQTTQLHCRAFNEQS